MLRIRLSKIGKKNEPHFRLILIERAKAVKGKFIEILGHYNPRSKKGSFNQERILYWLSQGAQASDTAHNLLVKHEIIKEPKRKIKIKLKKKTSGQEQEASDKSAIEETKLAEPKEEIKKDIIKEEKQAEAKEETEPKEIAEPQEKPKEEEEI